MVEPTDDERDGGSRLAGLRARAATAAGAGGRVRAAGWSRSRGWTSATA